MRHLLALLFAGGLALPSRAEVPDELIYHLSTKTSPIGIECTLASVSVSRRPAFGFTLGIKSGWMQIHGQIVSNDPALRHADIISIAVDGVAYWLYLVRTVPKPAPFTVGQVAMPRKSSLAMLRDVATAARQGKTVEIVAGVHRRRLSTVGLAEAIEAFLRCVSQRVT